MDLYSSAVFFAIFTLISTYLVAMAYKNVKFVLKHKWVDGDKLYSFGCDVDAYLIVDYVIW